jgi:hypothetical protein
MIDGYAYGNVLQNVANSFDKKYWDLDQEKRSV